MEICNEVAGSYKAPSNKNIIKSMRSIRAAKQQNTDAAKIQKITKYLRGASGRESSISSALSKVYKVHEMHTKASIIRERKLRRSMRLSMIHPSNITDGNYNS